jgi:SAM-dependent methyltransferase
MTKLSLTDNLKMKFKAFPKLYHFITLILGPSLQRYKHYRSLFSLVPEDEMIVNLGSGPIGIPSSRKIINLDSYGYRNVDVLADIQHTPLKDNSFGGVINIAVLEHTENPQLVVKEIRRILKPGGYAYIVVPFVFPFHSAPDDYYRWTEKGVKRLFRDFEEVKMGIFSGPTSALLLVLHEWLSLFFSFQSRYLYQILWVIFMILLSPFKIIDFYLSRHPEAHKVSACIYYICKKTFSNSTLDQDFY